MVLVLAFQVRAVLATIKLRATFFTFIRLVANGEICDILGWLLELGPQLLDLVSFFDQSLFES